MSPYTAQMLRFQPMDYLQICRRYLVCFNVWAIGLR